MADMLSLNFKSLKYGAKQWLCAADGMALPGATTSADSAVTKHGCWICLRLTVD